MTTEAECTRPEGEDSHRTKGLLRLTMACNERCPFCNVPAEDYERLTPSMDETLQELQRFLDDDAGTLTVSGGEPTLLRKRLIEVIRRARAGGVRFVELQTNATLIDDRYAEELAEAGCTSAFVSLLSHVPEHHDTLAGLPGAFDKCLRGIDALLDHGVRVTLNPVTAWLTQELVPDYIDFVAARLPRVTFISMSAVQPHGRARDDWELLPDYAVLRRTIPEARRRAEGHGIELVNPYCGLPLCVGWHDDLERSVEAFEARQGGWRHTHGLDNLGNKSHGPACARCAFRPRCGGAWHAYWDRRDGSGIAPPAEVVEPWVDGADACDVQQVLAAPGGPDPRTWAAASDLRGPTVWLWTDRLRGADVAPLLDSPVTDLALELGSLDPDAYRESLQVVRRIARASQHLQPQLRVRIVVGLRPLDGMNPHAVERVLSLLDALGVDGVRILSDAEAWTRLARAHRRATGRDVAAIAARPLPATGTNT